MVGDQHLQRFIVTQGGTQFLGDHDPFRELHQIGGRKSPPVQFVGLDLQLLDCGPIVRFRGESQQTSKHFVRWLLNFYKLTRLIQRDSCGEILWIDGNTRQ